MTATTAPIGLALHAFDTLTLGGGCGDRHDGDATPRLTPQRRKGILTGCARRKEKGRRMSDGDHQGLAKTDSGL
ncbi:MAG: hypothetical protein LBU07_06010, partial [Coriobacteriales bacterium]|nr:hypothetical protein [Coriobacteriales bacterium]